jgi:hypothetical protein
MWYDGDSTCWCGLGCSLEAECPNAGDGWDCNDNGSCVPECVPIDCTGLECGGDGCGGSCGTCDAGFMCSENVCIELGDVIPEIEPNDAPADATDLGPLSAGTTYTVSGVASTVSNDGSTWTGDIDFIAFQVPAAGTVNITLDWAEGAADYDLALYNVVNDQLNFLIESYYDKPEAITGQAVSDGELYFIFIAGWEGNPGDWTLLIEYN